MNKLITAFKFPLVLLASLSIAGCATIKPIAVDAGSCAAPAVQAEVANLLPAVTAILVGGAPNWQAQLTALESVGVQLVVCAVEVAVADLAKRTAATWSATAVDYTSAVARGKKYLYYYGKR
jgi:hypothetical protein